MSKPCTSLRARSATASPRRQNDCSAMCWRVIPRMRKPCDCWRSCKCIPVAHRLRSRPCKRRSTSIQAMHCCIATSAMPTRQSATIRQRSRHGREVVSWILATPWPRSTSAARTSSWVTPPRPSKHCGKPARWRQACCRQRSCWAMRRYISAASKRVHAGIAMRCSCTRPAATRGAGCPTSRRWRCPMPMRCSCPCNCSDPTSPTATASRWAMRLANWKRTADASRKPLPRSLPRMRCNAS